MRQAFEAFNLWCLQRVFRANTFWTMSPRRLKAADLTHTTFIVHICSLSERVTFSSQAVIYDLVPLL